jgi:hypothetical protein
VLPFDGLPAHARPAEEWFAYHLAKPGFLVVLSPAQVEVILGHEDQDGSVAWQDDAKAAAIGRSVGADLVARGRVSFEQSGQFQPGLPVNATCEVKLIQTSDGGEVSTVKTLDHILGHLERHAHVMRAAQKASFEILQNLSADGSFTPNERIQNHTGVGPDASPL